MFLPQPHNRFWRMNGLLEGRMLLRDFARNYIVKSPHLVLLFPTALTTPESWQYMSIEYHHDGSIYKNQTSSRHQVLPKSHYFKSIGIINFLMAFVLETSWHFQVPTHFQFNEYTIQFCDEKAAFEVTEKMERGCNCYTLKQSLEKQFQDFVVIKDNCTEEWTRKYNAMKRINWGQFKVQNLARGQLSKLVHVHYTNKL